MTEHVLALGLLVAAFATYIAVYLHMRRLPPRLYLDERVNQSGVRSFRDPTSCPYLLDFFPVMHALHRRLMARVPIDREIEIGRLVNIGSILLHSAGMALLVGQFHGAGVAMAATAWWMLGGWGLGFHVGRLCNYTERAFGDLLTFAGFAAFLLLAGEAWWLRLAVVAVLWAPVWHSSKFGVQALLLIGPIGALLLGDALLAAAMVGSFTVSVALFGRVVIEQQWDALGHTIWYWRSGVSYLRHVPGPKETLRQRVTAFIARHQVLSHFLIYLPALPIIVALVLKDVNVAPGLGDKGFSEAELIALAAVAASAITLVGKMVVIGPSARYAAILLPFLYARVLDAEPHVGALLMAAEMAIGVGIGLLHLKRLTSHDAESEIRRHASLARLLQVAREAGPARIVTDPLRLAEIIQTTDPPRRLRFVSFGFTPSNMSIVERLYPVMPRMVVDREGVRSLVDGLGIDGVLLDVGFSDADVRKAFEAEGFSEMARDDGFALLWLAPRG